MNNAALFVATENSLRQSGGGVQKCTAEYLNLLREGYQLEKVTFTPDQRIKARIAGRILKDSYRRQVPRDLSTRILHALSKGGARTVFFNLGDFAREAFNLRRAHGFSVKLVHLSHGLDSTDILVNQQFIRAAKDQIGPDRAAARLLGGKLEQEADYRRYLNGCVCLTRLDAELERWLGAARTFVIGKSIRQTPLRLAPVSGRVGTVATLDHPPNINGLMELFSALEKMSTGNLKFRLVGGPDSVGRSLTTRFGFVEYLGSLSDEDLEAEAATWCSFVNPVFAYARGCSTKIAVALGWELPILTTAAGARGYNWDEKIRRLSTHPDDLAAAVMTAKEADQVPEGSNATRRISLLQTSPREAAKRLFEFLNSL